MASHRPVTGITLQVLAHSGDEPAGKEITLHKSQSTVVTVGRQSSAPADVSDGPESALLRCPVISRKHARIAFSENGNVYLVDLKSHHGTHILKMGEFTARMLAPETPSILSDNDLITFGKAVGKDVNLVRPVSVRVKLLRDNQPSLEQGNAVATSLPQSAWGRFGTSLDDSSSESDSDVQEIPNPRVAPPPAPGAPCINALRDLQSLSLPSIHGLLRHHPQRTPSPEEYPELPPISARGLSFAAPVSSAPSPVNVAGEVTYVRGLSDDDSLYGSYIAPSRRSSPSPQNDSDSSAQSRDSSVEFVHAPVAMAPPPRTSLSLSVRLDYPPQPEELERFFGGDPNPEPVSAPSFPRSFDCGTCDARDGGMSIGPAPLSSTPCTPPNVVPAASLPPSPPPTVRLPSFRAPVGPPSSNDRSFDDVWGPSAFASNINLNEMFGPIHMDPFNLVPDGLGEGDMEMSDAADDGHSEQGEKDDDATTKRVAGTAAVDELKTTIAKLEETFAEWKNQQRRKSLRGMAQAGNTLKKIADLGLRLRALEEMTVALPAMNELVRAGRVDDLERQNVEQARAIDELKLALPPLVEKLEKTGSERFEELTTRIDQLQPATPTSTFADVLEASQELHRQLSLKRKRAEDDENDGDDQPTHVETPVAAPVIKRARTGRTTAHVLGGAVLGAAATWAALAFS